METVVQGIGDVDNGGGSMYQELQAPSELVSVVVKYCGLEGVNEVVYVEGDAEVDIVSDAVIDVEIDASGDVVCCEKLDELFGAAVDAVLGAVVDVVGGAVVNIDGNSLDGL